MPVQPIGTPVRAPPPRPHQYKADRGAAPPRARAPRPPPRAPAPSRPRATPSRAARAAAAAARRPRPRRSSRRRRRPPPEEARTAPSRRRAPRGARRLAGARHARARARTRWRTASRRRCARAAREGAGVGRSAASQAGRRPPLWCSAPRPGPCPMSLPALDAASIPPPKAHASTHAHTEPTRASARRAPEQRERGAGDGGQAGLQARRVCAEREDARRDGQRLVFAVPRLARLRLVLGTTAESRGCIC